MFTQLNVTMSINLPELYYDVTILIWESLSYSELLSLRATCKTLAEKMDFWTIGYGNMIINIDNFINRCINIIHTYQKPLFQHHGYLTSHCNISCDTRKDYRYAFCYYWKYNNYKKCCDLTHMQFIIQGVLYDCSNIMNNIEHISKLDFLVRIIEFNKEMTKNKPKNKLKSDISYHKFIKDMQYIFKDNDWSNKIKEIILGIADMSTPENFSLIKESLFIK